MRKFNIIFSFEIVEFFNIPGFDLRYLKKDSLRMLFFSLFQDWWLFLKEIHSFLFNKNT